MTKDTDTKSPNESDVTVPAEDGPTGEDVESKSPGERDATVPADAGPTSEDVDTKSPGKQEDPPKSLSVEFARLVRRFGKEFFDKFRAEKPPPSNWFGRFFSALLGSTQYFFVLVVISEARFAIRGREAASSGETMTDLVATQLVSLGAYISDFLGPTVVIVLVATIVGMALLVAAGAKRAGPLRSFFLGAATPALVHFIGAKVI